MVAATNDAGATLFINSYDAYGRPASTNQGRLQYTGQAYIASLGHYDYKARFYAPIIGKFLQSDPIGYQAGMNTYAYVGNDPINKTNPSGLAASSGSGSGSNSKPSRQWVCQIPDGSRTRVCVPVDSSSPLTSEEVQAVKDYIKKNGSGADGITITRIEFGASIAQINQMVISAYLSGEINGSKLNWNLKDPKEQAWKIIGYIFLDPISQKNHTVENTGENLFFFPNGKADAYAHTHPDWAGTFPGPGDFGYNVPLYGLTPAGVWVIYPGLSRCTWLYETGLPPELTDGTKR